MPANGYVKCSFSHGLGKDAKYAISSITNSKPASACIASINRTDTGIDVWIRDVGNYTYTLNVSVELLVIGA